MFYRFTNRKKIVTFVPGEFADKLMNEMSIAGAGRIGNYEMCSFRISGTGTFKPGKNTEPFKGRKHELFYADEVRFEMECDATKLNQVLDVMLKHHPYEEVAYEVYSAVKREKKSIGNIISLNKKINHQDLYTRLNPKKKKDILQGELNYSKLAFTEINFDENLLSSAKILECECLITKAKKIITLIN